VPDLKAAHMIVSGRVQGVFYRASAADQARTLGLSGWVRNLPDGRVEALFEGREAVILKMIDWCRLGPPSAKVSGVDVAWRAPEGFQGFEVRR